MQQIPESQPFSYSRNPMKKTLIIAFALFANTASADKAPLIASESRDASLAYIMTTNMIINNFGKQCLPLIGRSESPTAYRQAWQDRNAPFVQAAANYMMKRMEEAFDMGGKALRDSTMHELVNATGNESTIATQEWLGDTDQESACTSAIAVIDNGEFDFNDTMPIYPELEALIAWSKTNP